MLSQDILDLVEYGIQKKLVDEEDRQYITNRILWLFNEDVMGNEVELTSRSLEEILESLVQEASSRGIIDGGSRVQKDNFDTEIMNVFSLKPSQITKKFYELLETSPKKATDFFYEYCKDINYIRRDRILKDYFWEYKSDYGNLKLIINLSKPEKSQIDIINENKKKLRVYPKCMLCKENEGYAGGLNYNSKATLRSIPLDLKGNWFIQYSPYVYYQEHCIVFSEEHKKMVIDNSTFSYLMDFVEVLPHYFIGSNAGLPIVGGSILNHLHYQGGNCDLPIFNAKDSIKFEVLGYENIELSILDWPMTTIKIVGKDRESVQRICEKVLKIWENFDFPEENIISRDEEGQHNTITPILKKIDGYYNFFLILRNNLTTLEKPFGVFHPTTQYHNIKKENIGLLEAAGYAVLPGRLKKEKKIIEEYMVNERNLDPEIIIKHKSLIDLLKSCKEKDFSRCIDEGIGEIFKRILEDCSIFKGYDTKGLKLFLEKLKN
ncbi:galactose-1-phosphate uridylyltransferase [Lagierella sp.]|uniref:galactose-1-phosphate uridylyltransferase n=1 Tax=Lagierella sp. TaxID=2849657 RepID=UPI0026201D33|nr:galactose-1-phosphate uridylyltransferase [Lagierella sp.]